MPYIKVIEEVEWITSGELNSKDVWGLFEKRHADNTTCQCDHEDKCFSLPTKQKTNTNTQAQTNQKKKEEEMQ